MLLWFLFKIFCLIKGGKLIEGVFKGEMINILFMLCVEDYLDVLSWLESLGGFMGLCVCVNNNLKVFENWVINMDWIEFFVVDLVCCLNIFVCLKIVDLWVMILLSDD